MAATKKTSMKSTSAQSIADETVTEVENVDCVDEVVATSVHIEPKEVTDAPKTPKKYAPGDLIECRSITAGELIMIGLKTKLQYVWSNFGDTAFVEYQDLQALQSLRSNFLTKPRFMIEDEELVSQWSGMLKPIYDKIYDRDIDEFFNLSLTAFKTHLKNMPSGMIDTVKTKAAEMIKNEELYDLRKIRIIDETLGTEFVDLFLK